MIPAKAIEAAAQAVYEKTRYIAERRDVRSDPYPKWESLHPLMKDAMLDSARAALEAAVPYLTADATPDEKATACRCGHDASAHHLYEGRCRPGSECDCLQMVHRFDKQPVCSHCGGVGHTIGRHF